MKSKIKHKMFVYKTVHPAVVMITAVISVESLTILVSVSKISKFSQVQ